jgi:hypothetical protein
MKLSEALRKVAQRYDAPDAKRNPIFNYGICWAVSSLAYDGAYLAVDDALAEIEDGWAECLAVRLAPCGHAYWEPRAWMCLLMAEWLEEDGR